MFKVNNRNTRTKCIICSKLTKTPGVFIVKFEHNMQLFVVFSNVNFEQVNTGWQGA